MTIRAWMIHILLNDTVENGEWVEDFRMFQSKEKNAGLFTQAKRLRKQRRRNRAIQTLLPHQYLSDDAITFCLAAIKYKPPPGTYVYDTALSVSTESQLWNTLWRASRKKNIERIDTIILPINVHDIHWYVAILSINEKGIEINIQNNNNIRNVEAEVKLRNVGKRYYEQMWDSLTTPRKGTKVQDQKKQSRENTVVQTLNRPRQIQNKISRCLNFNAEYKGRAKDKENETEAPPHEMELRGSIDEDDYSEEEVIYSEGEPFEMLYPNNTWDSDDASLEEHLSQPSGWI